MKSRHILLLFSLAFLPAHSLAALSIAQSPLFATAPVEPRVMLLMSRDHELSKKAYNDYTDLNGDGALDITYTDAIEYYGYFDPKKCYAYSSANSRFEPQTLATGTNLHECSGQWSGNFLNWATMTRLDVVRKVLYGGFRSTDGTGTTLGTTVLERAFLPPDVHAFSKVFAPSAGATDVAKFTPYSVATISLCNVTDMGDGVQAGTVNTVNGTNTSAAPLIKVATGSWPLWAMTEILQCQWQEQTVEASPTRPSTASGHRLTGSSDLIARVAVCAPGMLESQCKSYFTRDTTPVETVKPTGLLQQYGDVDELKRARFGLMTGSYKKNTSGAVLRKNISLLSNNGKAALSSSSICGDNDARDEVNVCTGQFINQSASDTGIIDTLNRIHIAGYKTPSNGSVSSTNVCAGGYGNSAPFACSASNLLSGTNGTCVDWGNPLSEMYHEALRYFSGKTSATAAYAVDDSAATAVIAGLGQDTWNSASDPLPSTEWCALSSIVLLSTGLTSLDNASISTDISGLDPATLTNEVGTAEGVDSHNFLIGSNGTISDNLCSAKTLSNLSSASGICPELPHMKGGYLIAGLAKSNRSLDLRPGYAGKRSSRWAGINADWVARQPLSTYAVGLAENLPSFEITVGSGKVIIVPSCGSGSSTPYSVCSMTDLRVESQTATSGSFLISWEDNSAGSDYDMDTISRIEYCVGPTCSPSVSSDQIKITVSAVQAATGSTMNLGYTVSGTSNDGTVFPVRLLGTATCNPTDCSSGSANNRFFSLLSSPPSWRCTNHTAWPSCPGGGPAMPTGIVNATGCPSGSNCGCPKATTYTQSATPAGLLKNPLWYAAKYGASAASWDLFNNVTGSTGADGEPDNFFDVRNPALLYERLSAVIERAATKESSASALATNSTRLDTQTVVYQAKFNTLDWGGVLLAYPIGTDGVVASTPSWSTDSTLTTTNTRDIATFNGSSEVAFQWNNLSCTQKGHLSGDSAATIATNCATTTFYDTNTTGQNRLNWFRGQPQTGMRTRSSILGDIINSDPIFVYQQNYGYHLMSYNLDTTTAGNTIKNAYAAFLDSTTDTLSKTNASHIPLIFVGANDGMLHVFRADTGQTDSGKEVFAYVPYSVFPNLASLTQPTYSHQYYVDGTVGTGDAYIDTGDGLGLRWRTIVVGSLGAGGKSVFALDVTDTSNIKVLWEKDSTSTGWGELGAVVAPPVIANIITTGSNRTWAAVFGNGYNSVSGNARLFIVNLITGAVIQTVDTGVGGDNGLGQPAIYNQNFNAYVGDADSSDAIYAGDLKGNIWKFVQSGTGWVSAYASGGTSLPLFQATDGTNPQPVTGPLEIGAAPTGQAGVMIQFGTGKYFEPSDVTSSSQQTLYGIWDSGSAISTTDRSDLQAQTLTYVTVNGVQSGYASSNTVNYPTKRGWFLDLPSDGSRVVSSPLLRHGRALFAVIVPENDPCLFGGSSWYVEVDATTGANLGYPVFDIDENRLFNNADSILVDGVYRPVSAIRFPAGLIKPPAIISAGEIEYKVTGTTGGQILVTGEKGATSYPRASWREIR